MKMTRPRIGSRAAIAFGVAALSLITAACSSGSSSSQSTGTGTGTGAGTTGLTVPTANLPVLQKIGKGEGQLNLIAWEATWTPSG